MKKTRTSYAPLIVAVVLLLLPLLYVGSYLALVVPAGAVLRVNNAGTPVSTMTLFTQKHYRFGGKQAERFYWPLETLDRKLRPGLWSDRLERIGVDFN